jgi:hypothetical protein
MKASLSPTLKSQQLLQRLGFALLALILMLSASCSLYLLSAVRAFVNGESLWSKAQKDAIYSLSAMRMKATRRLRPLPAGLAGAAWRAEAHCLYDKPCAWTWRAKA